jgi:hypothetical protein
MNYNSPRKIFRDMYKNPDSYPNDFEEKATIKSELERDRKISKAANTIKQDVVLDLNAATKVGDEKEVGEKNEVFTSHGKSFKQVVDSIFEAGLIDGVDNPEELKIIRQRQEIVLNYLSKILEDIKNYLNQVSVLESQKKDNYEDLAKYQSIIGRSDATRRSYHNKLIGDVKIAMRLININFNADFPDDLRFREELKMPDRKGLAIDNLKKLMSQRKYFKFPFPVGVFMDFRKSPKDPQGEREYIAHWALQLYVDLSALDSEMRKILHELK